MLAAAKHVLDSVLTCSGLIGIGEVTYILESYSLFEINATNFYYHPRFDIRTLALLNSFSVKLCILLILLAGTIAWCKKNSQLDWKIIVIKSIAAGVITRILAIVLTKLGLPFGFFIPIDFLIFVLIVCLTNSHIVLYTRIKTIKRLLNNFCIISAITLVVWNLINISFDMLGFNWLNVSIFSLFTVEWYEPRCPSPAIPCVRTASCPLRTSPGARSPQVEGQRWEAGIALLPFGQSEQVWYSQPAVAKNTCKIFSLNDLFLRKTDAGKVCAADTFTESTYASLSIVKTFKECAEHTWVYSLPTFVLSKLSVGSLLQDGGDFLKSSSFTTLASEGAGQGKEVGPLLIKGSVTTGSRCQPDLLKCGVTYSPFVRLLLSGLDNLGIHKSSTLSLFAFTDRSADCKLNFRLSYVLFPFISDDRICHLPYPLTDALGARLPPKVQANGPTTFLPWCLSDSCSAYAHLRRTPEARTLPHFSGEAGKGLTPCLPFGWPDVRAWPTWSYGPTKSTVTNWNSLFLTTWPDRTAAWHLTHTGQLEDTGEGLTPPSLPPTPSAYAEDAVGEGPWFYDILAIAGIENEDLLLSQLPSIPISPEYSDLVWADSRWKYDHELPHSSKWYGASPDFDYQPNFRLYPTRRLMTANDLELFVNSKLMLLL